MGLKEFNNTFLVSLGLQLEGKLPLPFDVEQWPKAKEEIARVFLTKTQSEWCETFKDLDACVTPVLTVDEAVHHPHNKERKTFIFNDGVYEPSPAPKLSRSPGHIESKIQPKIGEHSVEVLQEVGYSQTEIQEMISNGVVDHPDMKSSL